MENGILKDNSYNKNFILLKTTIFVFIFSLCFDSFAKAPPESFADLSDKVSPAVVNIATSVAVKDSPPREIPNFPPGSPFELKSDRKLNSDAIGPIYVSVGLKKCSIMAGEGAAP